MIEDKKQEKLIEEEEDSFKRIYLKVEDKEEAEKELKNIARKNRRKRRLRLAKHYRDTVVDKNKTEEEPIDYWDMDSELEEYEITDEGFEY